MFGEFTELFRIHQIGGKVLIADVPLDCRGCFGAFGLEVDRRQIFASTSLERLFSLQDLVRQLLRETIGRKPHFALEQRHHGIRKGDGLVRITHVLGAKAVGDHGQRHVADDLGRGRHLDDVAKQQVHLRIGLFHLRPAVIQTHCPGLFAQIRVLPARHLVPVNALRAGAHVGFERGIVAAHALPILRQLLQPLQVHARLAPGMRERSGDTAKVGLGGQPAHCVQRPVHYVCARFDRGEHARRRHAAGVVGMEVDGQTDLLLQHPHQFTRRRRPAYPRHVLDAENVGSGLFQLLRHIDVVLELVLGSRGIEQVAGVADRRFKNGA